MQRSDQQGGEEVFEIFSFLEQMVFIDSCTETQLVGLVIAEDKLNSDIAEALPEFSGFIHLRTGFKVMSLYSFHPVWPFKRAHIGHLDAVFLIQDPFFQEIEKVGNFSGSIAGFVEENGESLTGGRMEKFNRFCKLLRLMQEQHILFLKFLSNVQNPAFPLLTVR